MFVPLITNSGFLGKRVELKGTGGHFERLLSRADICDLAVSYLPSTLN